MLDYLENKRNLTVGVNNAAVAVNNAEHAREDMKFKYKAIYIGMVVVLPIMAVVTAYAPLFVGPLVVDLWGFAIPFSGSLADTRRKRRFVTQETT